MHPANTGKSATAGDVRTERELWRIEDFCAAFGRSKSFVYNALSSHDLEGVKIGRSTLLTGDSVRRWRASLPKFQSGQPLNSGAEVAA